MIKLALIGIGKMGLSHLSILGAHPKVQITGVCDSSSMVTDVISRFSPFPCFTDYHSMISTISADAFLVAVPTKLHASIVEELIRLKKHVFVEKPFCMHVEDSNRLASLAEHYGVVNQVGFHNRFIGTFTEVRRLVTEGWIGDIYHFHAQAYGPVVLRPYQTSWRSNNVDGGGCLMDYASHVIDLVQYILGPVESVDSGELRKIFSKNVEDAVYAVLTLSSKIKGMLSVNWSDETYRKMSTSIQLNGTSGKIIADANELKIYFKSSNVPTDYEKGWNVRYITDLTPPVNFYLRGEEYTAQLDYFIEQIENTIDNPMNSFRSAAHTDLAISLIKEFK